MKKISMSIVVVLMLVLALSLGVANAFKPMNSTQRMTMAKTYVDSFFEALNKSATTGSLGLGNSRTADMLMLKQIAELAEHAGTYPNGYIGAIFYILFELHIDDEISCAITVQEAKELKELKDNAFMAGGGAMVEYLRDPLNSPYIKKGKSPEAYELVKQLNADVWQTIPLIKKVYMKHPDRKHC